MNGKIKTKFAALFAVALMITVCVVPVVGNEDVQAASSSDVGYNEITVSGAVYDGGETPLIGAKVTIDAGSYSVDAFTDSYGKYSGVVYYSGDNIATLTVTIDNSSTEFGSGDNKYSNPANGLFIDSNKTLTFTGVTDDIKDANLYGGMVAISGKLFYGNGSEKYVGAVEVGIYVPDTDGKYGITSTKIGSSTGSYILYVPMSVMGTAKEFKVGAKFADGDIAYSEKYTKVESKNVDLKSTKSFIFEVDADSYVANETVAFTGTGKYGSTSVAITEEGTFIGVFTYNAEATEDSTFVASNLKYGTISVNSLPSVTGVTSYTYNATNVISGSVYMDINNNKVYAADDIKITAYYKSGTNDAVKIGEGNVVDGEYVIYYETFATIPTFDKVYLTTSYDDSVEYAMSNFQFNKAYSANIDIDDTGYQYVSGKITGINNSNISGVTVTVTGGNIFGDTTPITDKDGKYAVMVFTGSKITITPDGTYGYDLETAQAEVYGSITQNFVMKSKEVTFTVTDRTKVVSSSASPFEGVKIFYSLDYKSETVGVETVVSATWNSTPLVTDEKGQAKLVVNGNANVTWYADYDGRLFTNDKTNPIKNVIDKTTSITTKDNLYNVDFKHNSNAFNLNGISLPEVIVVNEEFYTEGPSLIASSTKGNAYFYADTPASGVYKLYFENGMFGDYYVSSAIQDVGSVNSYVSQTDVTLTQNVAIGYVVEKDGSVSSGVVLKGLAGMNVDVFDSSDKLIAETTTLENGYFKVAIVGNYTASKITVTAPEGSPYTFAEKEAYSEGSVFHANEQTYEGDVIDNNNKKIVNADITVKAVDADGKVIGSIAKVEANGSFKIVTDKTKATKVVTVDADGKYTFDNGNINSSYNFQIKANQATYTITVNNAGDKAIVGAGVEVLLGNAADGYTVVAGDLVTDKDGKVEVFLTKPKTGDNYKAKVTYGMGLEKESNDVAFNTIIKSDIYLREIAIKSAANVDIKEAGYLIKVLDNTTGKEVGTATTDSSGIARFYSAANATTFAVESPEGSPYTFETECLDLDVVAVDGVAKGTMNAEQTLYSGSVQSLNDVKLEGVTVTLKNAIGKVVGTGVTDKDGKYEIVAINANTAIASDAELAIGKFTFDEDETSLDSPKEDSFKTIEANENLYSGYYANGAVVKDVEVSYMDSGVKSLAKVIDNKYFIVTKTDLVTAKTEVTATAPNFNAVGMIAAANAPLAVGDVPTYNAYFKPSMGAQILGPYSGVVYGTVITLAAQNEYSEEVFGEDGVIQKYKFAGWYVNGVKVSDELIYAYTVEGNCTIYADYEVSSYETGVAAEDNSNDLSMDVLVLGIVIVVLGLLAFAYAVKFKKE